MTQFKVVTGQRVTKGYTYLASFHHRLLFLEGIIYPASGPPEEAALYYKAASVAAAGADSASGGKPTAIASMQGGKHTSLGLVNERILSGGPRALSVACEHSAR